MMKAEQVLTGRHVLTITVLSFAVIIGVNILLAVQAVRTFPGLEVENSYVASQDFQVEMEAQKALGWSLAPSYHAGALTLTFTGADGAGVQPAEVQATVGRTTEAKDDQMLVLSGTGGQLSAPVALQPGKWMLLVQAKAADGTGFRQRLNLFVKAGQ